ncbi:uncharacterized protein SCHCODRAFT_02630315 [Schizophyllum commune H4-8]|uniref:uncharacterized protein n=1 Tax=Schizophyllum commune (strain H4-8 / FGSC 9210) TaxID=578458 RepID=UPI0021603F01|nr:uncharacterized protein SCHCODRAFT_02630315 [Schizophyllum commune H4-8]KAI5889877.1 hypothetical protein SCHCODRAFT_02630315 [Schizophyllum commune H4-8]
MLTTVPDSALALSPVVALASGVAARSAGGNSTSFTVETGPSFKSTTHLMQRVLARAFTSLRWRYISPNCPPRLSSARPGYASSVQRYQSLKRMDATTIIYQQHRQRPRGRSNMRICPCRWTYSAHIRQPSLARVP